MHRLSPGQRWVVGLGVFALVLLVVGLVAVITTVHASGWCLVASNGSDQTWEGCETDDSGIIWGGALAVIGLLHLGLTGAVGALVWTSTPTIGPKPVREEFHVFTVGDLAGSAAQDALFGRIFRAVEDVVPGWRFEDGTSRPGGPDDSIVGSVVRLDAEWQLAVLDRRAGAGVRRVQVELASGARAWIFTPIV
ncbi:MULTISPECIES: hypothetical protein [Curtobacterium]|uniref:hypothetical protein n=1 Tax=Curtobacterium flaccumfaciens TaxID=2035 RepID=UPI003EE6AC40